MDSSGGEPRTCLFGYFEVMLSKRETSLCLARTQTKELLSRQQASEGTHKEIMDLIEKNDLDSQMTVLQGSWMEDEEEEETHKISEVQDFSISLKEIQEEIVNPKLQCLMMDPAFSMVTLQSADSGILWETASSRCSTPWASEISSPATDLCTSLVPRHPTARSSENAGKILFIIDEDHMIGRKKRKRDTEPDKRATLADDKPEEPDRPAMVEVSLPNMTDEKEKRDKTKDRKEARKQHLFRLVSEGSEILNIVVPPRLSTVDEEESKGLKDNLSYLEETPVTKATEIPEEPEEEQETENLEQLHDTLQEIALPMMIKPVRKQGVCEDYFEKFTLLDHQAPSGVPTEGENHEPKTTSEDELDEGENNAIDSKPEKEVLDDSVSNSGPEVASEHVDEVFYGSGRHPDFYNTTKCVEDEQRKSALKKSGSALFGSQESILTPIFLPEGPQKIIDLVLLEEPKAMAFMYSDLYAEAVGNRTKQDDTESVTSEKSFHSQESDLEDRGYLEKFVLIDETPETPMDPLHNDCKEDGVRMWSQDTFGLIRHDNLNSERLDDADEITDFFRNSASSSPCEPIRLRDLEPEKTRTETKVRRVVFQDERQERTTEEDIDIAEAFLPLDIGMEASLEAADYKSIINEYAARTCAATPSRSEKNKFSSKVKAPKTHFIPIHVPQSVKPVTPCHKPFLELTPLLPVEMPEIDGPKEEEWDNVCSTISGQGEDISVEV